MFNRLPLGDVTTKTGRTDRQSAHMCVCPENNGAKGQAQNTICLGAALGTLSEWSKQLLLTVLSEITSLT